MQAENRNSAILLSIATILFVRQATASDTQGIISTFAGGGPKDLPAISTNVRSPGQIAIDKSGKLYFVDGVFELFTVTPSGMLAVVAGNGFPGAGGDGGPAIQAQLVAEQVATDSTGNIYIAPGSDCVVRKITVNTGIITTVAGDRTKGCGYSGDGGSALRAQLSGVWGVAVDASNNLYIADTGNQRIRKVNASTGEINTIAGIGVLGFAGDGGPATDAELGNPLSLAIDGFGNLYVFDSVNYRIRKITASTGKISTIAGNGVKGSSGDGGDATSAEIGRISEVASDFAGNVFIADTNSCVIREINGTTGKINAVAGNYVCGYSGDGGAATSAELARGVDGVAVDSSGNLYIADAGNFRIRKVTRNTGLINTIAGNGTYGYSGNDIPATSSALFDPYNATPDASGNVYIAESENCLIRKVSDGKIGDFAGTAPTIAFSLNCGYSGDGGAATRATLNFPAKAVADSSGNVYIADAANCVIRRVSASGVINTFARIPQDERVGCRGDRSGVALDASGNLYIADLDNAVVRKVSGGIISTVAGNGTFGFSGDGGLATNAQLNNPSDVAVDSSGNLYIADYSNGRVRVVNRSGIISTFAGTGTLPKYPYVDKSYGIPAINANIWPRSVAVDSAGDVIIGEASSRVRWVDGRGLIYTLAGNGTYGFSGDGGLATKAELTDATGVGVDPSGNIYVADFLNSRVRKVAAIANLNPSAYDLSFQQQPVGTTSKPQKITLKGIGPLIINSITTTGDFTEADDCPSSSTLGLNCSVQITFTPSGAGTRTGKLVIATNGFFNPAITVDLKGSGEGLAYSPASLNFGNQAVGTKTPIRTITFTNRSSSSVTLNGVTTTNAAFSVASNTCAGTVAGGKTCAVGITFKPSVKGSVTANLEVREAGSARPQLIPLSGNGIGTRVWPICVVSASPATITAGMQAELTFTCDIQDPSLIPQSVNVLRVDGAGRIVATLGVMRDDGLLGDLVAGDKIFTLRVNFSEAAVGEVRLRVSAAFRGVLLRALSETMIVTVQAPSKLPPI